MESSVKSLIFIPSINISPESASYNFASRLKIVVLPVPDFPTKATVVLASTLNDKSLSTGILSL